MLKKIIAVTGLAAAAFPAFGADLWDQFGGVQANWSSAYSGSPAELADTLFSDSANASYSIYQVSDVVVGSTGWNVTSISTVVDFGFFSPPTSGGTANLEIFNNSGSAPTATAGGSTVSVTYSAFTNANGATGLYTMTASGLNLNLSGGEYWVGLDAILNYGTQGEASLVEGSNVAGARYDTFANNVGGGFFAAGWTDNAGIVGNNTAYGAIDLQGTPAPEPVSMTLLGIGAVGLIARRKRS